MSDLHEHEGCSCDHNHNVPEEMGEDTIVTLTMEDDSEVDCAVIAIYPVGEKEYIALLPLDEEGDNKDGEVYIYRYTEVEGEDPALDNIDDDDEYEAAADAFDEILDAAEFDEE